MPGWTPEILCKAVLLIVALLLAGVPAVAGVPHHDASHHAMPAPVSVEAASTCADADMVCGDQDHQGTDVTCCFADICTMLSGWLPASPVVPAHLALAAADYPEPAAQSATGLQPPPPLPPPEPVV